MTYAFKQQSVNKIEQFSVLYATLEQYTFYLPLSVSKGVANTNGNAAARLFLD